MKGFFYAGKRFFNQKFQPYSQYAAFRVVALYSQKKVWDGGKGKRDSHKGVFAVSWSFIDIKCYLVLLSDRSGLYKNVL